MIRQHFVERFALMTETPEARLRVLHTSPSRTRRFVDVSSAR